MWTTAPWSRHTSSNDPGRHTEASASVGVSRDARIDGYTPAIIPTSTAPPSPVSADDNGTTTGHPWYAAYTAVPARPIAVPATPPSAASTTDSVRNCPRI